MQASTTDLAAFGRLVEAHYSAVAAVAFAITRNATLAEDVAQETFAAAWGSLDRLRDPASMRAWLCGIARNQAKSALRSRGREVGVATEPVDARPSVVESAVDRERAGELSDALAEIPAQYREPLVLFYWEDQSIEQVASALAITAQAAQKRISRARAYLKEGLTARFTEGGRAHKQAAASAAAAIVAVLASRPTAASAATAATTKGSTMWATGIGKGLLIAATAAVLVAGVAIWRSQASDAVSATSPAAAPAVTATGSAGAATRAPSLPAIGAGSSAPARAYAPGEPSPRPTFGAPDAYELSTLSPTSVAVNLEGGPSQTYSPRPPQTPDFSRHVRGRVVDASGRGVAGAVVVIGEQIRVMWGTLQGEQGAVSGADGRFDIVAHRADAAVVMALHGRGWSTVVQIAAGSTDLADVVVPIGAPGTLSIRATQRGVGREASLVVSAPGLHMMIESDVHGAFALPRLAPGRYHVAARPLQTFAGGAAAKIERDETVTAGAVTRVDIELATGSLLVVTPTFTRELSTVEYFLTKGTERLELAELSKRSRAGTVMATLFGGSDLRQPMQFHELAPGTYTLCIDARADDDDRTHLPLDCRTVELAADKPLVELEVAIP